MVANVRRNMLMSESDIPARVCMVTSGLVLAEARDWVRALVKGVVGEGVTVELLVPASGLATAPTDAARIWQWPTRLPVAGSRELIHLAERMAEPGPPLLHALSRDAGSLATRLATLWKTRAVVTCHRPTGDLGRWMTHHRQQVGCVVATGAVVAEAVRRRYRLDEQHVPLVRQGVAVSGTVSCFSRPNHLPVVALAARPRNREPVLAALGAIRLMLDEGRQLHVLLLSGRSGPSRSIRSRIAELNLRNIVTVFDAALPLGQVLRSGDIFLQPYAQRRPSIDLLTAMACGLAPAVFAETPFDHLRHGGNALLLAASETGAIADSLRTAFADRRATRRLAHNAQETVAALHRPRTEIDALLAAYAQCTPD